MLVREGGLRTQAIDLRLAALLSFVAGALNAVGFQAAGMFSANMTGNVSAMADHLANGAWGIALLLGGIIVLFIFGAFLSGLLIQIGTQRRVAAIYAYVILIEGAVLLGLAALYYVLPDGARPASMTAVLGFVLGLQNAATTRISQARVRTTHVSGMATDIGLEIAGLLAARGERQSYASGLTLHVTTILAFLLGGGIGALGYLGLGGGVFAVAAALLALIAAPEALKARRPVSGAGM